MAVFGAVHSGIEQLVNYTRINGNLQGTIEVKASKLGMI